tara:strand:+ start:51786 stop:52310 length:525 start_codon:yes stop_codon:yes gene_type:complete
MNNKNIKKLNNFIVPAIIILLLSATRLIPHPYNFSPILAAGIFSGFYFRKFYLSFFIVALSMFIGDLFLGFHDTMFFTYISMGIAVAIGLYIKNFKFKEIIFSGLISSLSFYVITNFGAWLTLEMYAKDFSGLLQSYIMAIPFFHNTLLSTFFYLIVFKILFNLATRKKFSFSF